MPCTHVNPWKHSTLLSWLISGLKLKKYTVPYAVKASWLGKLCNTNVEIPKVCTNTALKQLHCTLILHHKCPRKGTQWRRTMFRKVRSNFMPAQSSHS